MEDEVNHPNEQFVDDENGPAYRNLAVFSLILLVIPFSVMYISNRIIRDRYHFTQSDSLILSVALAVASIYVIIAAFVYTAYNEDKTKVE